MKRHLRTSTVGLEDGRVSGAGPAVDAVGGDDEVGVGERGIAFDLVLEVLVHAELVGALLQHAPAGACGRCRRSRGRRS